MHANLRVKTTAPRLLSENLKSGLGCEWGLEGKRSSCLTQPYVAPHNVKIHTLITLGISIRTKRLVF
jgi:hypothetical protein